MKKTIFTSLIAMLIAFFVTATNAAGYEPRSAEGDIKNLESCLLEAGFQNPRDFSFKIKKEKRGGKMRITNFKPQLADSIKANTDMMAVVDACYVKADLPLPKVASNK